MAKPACGSWLASDGDSAVTFDIESAFSSRQTQQEQQAAQVAKPTCGSWLASDCDSAVVLDIESAFSSRQTQ